MSFTTRLLTLLAAATCAVPAFAQDTPVPAGPAVHVVLFTHIEDNTPGGVIGSTQARTQYLALRARLLEMGALAQRYGVPWTLQPDWKYLEAARVYEDAATTASTGGLNVFRYLHEVMGVAIDPHSHENGGYNYTDVAYLLQVLGVGGSTVIGGHIWDPDLPEFSEWDRFRTPQRGQHYPAAVWQGSILMGSGTPFHVNDPVVSGIWRPRDRADYFADDSAGTITAIGAYQNGLTGIAELQGLYAAGTIAPDCLLTATMSVGPSTLTAPAGIATAESTMVAPLAALKAKGGVVLTDFTRLDATWKTQYGAKACMYVVSER